MVPTIVLNFWSKATNSDTFLESRHPEVTENLYHILSTRQSGIPIFLASSSWANRYASWMSDPDVLLIDAVSISWENQFVYLFPTFSMI